MIVDLPHTVTSSLYSTFFLPLSHPLFFIKSATPQQATGNHQVQLNEGQGFTWISADEIVNFNFAYDFEHLIAEYFRHTTPNKSSQTTR